MRRERPPTEYRPPVQHSPATLWREGLTLTIGSIE